MNMFWNELMNAGADCDVLWKSEISRVDALADYMEDVINGVREYDPDIMRAVVYLMKESRAYFQGEKVDMKWRVMPTAYVENPREPWDEDQMMPY